MHPQPKTSKKTTGDRDAMLVAARDALGATVRIADLAGLKARGAQRPDWFCLACGGKVRAHLGRHRSHHFAHSPDTRRERCWATQPEGEQHILAKVLLERLLTQGCQRSAVLIAKLPCPSCTFPDTFQEEVVQLQPGYRVVVEGWGDPTRAIKPDLQVRDELGEPVAFVEVRVTHGNSDEKIRFVRNSKVPMIEIDGAEFVSKEVTATVFSCIGHENLKDTGACPACMQRRVDEDARRERERKEREATGQRERARHARDAKVRAAWPEAEKRALQRLERDRATLGVACCHVHFFVGPRCVAKRKLVVRLNWSGATTRLVLTEVREGKPIQVWKGVTKELQRIYATELPEAARRYSRAVAARVGPDTEVETFGGFKTGHFMVPPLSHLRAPKPNGRGWITAYPLKALVDAYGRGTVRHMAQTGSWTTIKTDSGTVAVSARSVDDYLKRSQFKPDLERPSKNSDPLWDAVVVEEVQRLVGSSIGPTA